MLKTAVTVNNADNVFITLIFEYSIISHFGYQQSVTNNQQSITNHQYSFPHFFISNQKSAINNQSSSLYEAYLVILITISLL